jgi:hypothetical protein
MKGDPHFLPLPNPLLRGEGTGREFQSLSPCRREVWREVFQSTL